MAQHTTVDIGIYCYFAMCIIGCLFVINWTIAFYKLQKTNIYLLSRRPWITFAIGIISSIGLGVERIHSMLFTISPIVSISNEHTVIYWKTMQTFMTHFTLILLQYIFLIRAWLTFYDIKFNQSVQDSEWIVHIDPTQVNKSWIIKYRSTLASPKYTSIVCIAVCSVFGGMATVYVALHGDFDMISRGLIGLNALLPTAMSLVLMCRLPIFYDIWKLRKEVKFCVYSQCIFIVSFLLYAAIIDPQPEHWSYLPLNILAVLAYLSMNYVVFQWVFNQFHLPWNVLAIYHAHKNGIYQFERNALSAIHANNIRKQQQKSIGKFLTLPDEEFHHNTNHAKNSFELKVKKRRDSLSVISVEQKEKCSIRAILQHPEGIKLFARHLSLEFASESFLFFMETQQFLDALDAHPVYHRHIKLLHTENCGLSVHDTHHPPQHSHGQNSNNTRLRLSNHGSDTGSSSPKSSLNRDADFISMPTEDITTRGVSTSLSFHSLSKQSSFMYDDCKYIHLKLPADIPKSRIVSSGYRTKVITRKSSRRTSYNNTSNIHSNNTVSSNANHGSNNSNSNNQQLRNSIDNEHHLNATPSQSANYLPKKPPSTLQLTALESDRQYTRDDYHDQIIGHHNLQTEAPPMPLSLRPEQSDKSVSAKRSFSHSNTTRNAGKSTSNTTSNTGGGLIMISSTLSGATEEDHGEFEQKEYESDDVYELEPYDQALLLFRKYIAFSATFCINISSQCRKSLYAMFGGDQTQYEYDEQRQHYIKICVHDEEKTETAPPPRPHVHDIYHCFDASRSEIYLLLQNSLDRFKLTGAFSEYLNIVAKV